MKAAATEAIGVVDIPTNFVNIGAVPVEAEIPCREPSAREFAGPNGIFSAVTKDKKIVDIFQMPQEVIIIDLRVNPLVVFGIGTPIPGCNADGVMYLAAKSRNVLGVADPVFIRGLGNRITNVKVFFTRVDKTKPAALGLRVKFQENGKPLRKSGTVTFP